MHKNFKLFHSIITRRNLPGAPAHLDNALRVARKRAHRFGQRLGVVRVSRNSAAGDLHGNSLSDSGPSPTGLRATRSPPRRFSRDRARHLASSLVAHVSRNDAGSAGARDLGPEPGGEPKPGCWMSGVLTKLTNAGSVETERSRPSGWCTFWKHCDRARRFHSRRFAFSTSIP